MPRAAPDEKKNAVDLHRSVHVKLLALPHVIEVYPAHFASSACRAGMSGKPSSTIAFEKRCNPLSRSGASDRTRS